MSAEPFVEGKALSGKLNCGKKMDIREIWKRYKAPLLMLAVLAALVGGYYGLRAYNMKRLTESVKDNGKDYTALVLDDTKMREIAYTYGDFTVVLRKEGDTWTSPDAPGKELLQTQVNPYLYRLKNMESDHRIENADLAEYGLDAPTHEVIVKTDAETHEVHIGSLNEMTSQYYFRVDDETTVYTMDESIAELFEVPLEELLQ